MLCWKLWKEIDLAGITEDEANDQMQLEMEKAYLRGTTDLFDREHEAATAYLASLTGGEA